MKNIVAILFIVFLSTGCREIIELKLPSAPEKLVIEGLVTDNEGPYTVVLSTVGDYFENNSPPTVSGAKVTISDISSGMSEILAEGEPGHYKTSSLRGTAGNTYQLQVEVNGEIFISTATMPIAPIFDSLNYKYQPESTFRDEGYYIYFYGKTDKSQINYYRWLVYENDSLYNDRSDYILATDEFIQENVRGLEFPYAFNEGDTVRITMFGLNREVYNYFNELVNLLFNDGGLFSSPPVNPTSNIRNETNPRNVPLGYFQVSPSTSREIIIK